MESENKRRWRWVSWFAVTCAGLVVAYPLSMGPVGWPGDQVEFPGWLSSGTSYVYAPIFDLLQYVPKPIASAYVEYLTWWYNTPLRYFY